MGRWLIAIAVMAACDSSFEADIVPPPNADPQVGCATTCHGEGESNAPPKSTAGATETTATAVGAHQAHLNPSPSWHAKVACADCHVVPESVGAPGHIDGDNRAEVTFSTRVGTSSWNGTTCTSGCHGSAAWGGTHPTPTWTQVDGAQSTCGSCHGAPPPAPHPPGSNCAACHPTMEENTLTFRDPGSHIDGKIDLVDPGATGGCTSCHGSPTNAAPPKDLAGLMSSPKVGAHQVHLQTSTWRHAIACSACHVVPQTVDAPGHRDDNDNLAEVTFDTMNPAGAFAAGTCSTMYCHGNGRGNTGSIAWVAMGPLACNACHSTTGANMSGRHRLHLEEGVRCTQCHSTVVDRDMQIINAALHINGVHEVRMQQGMYDPGMRRCNNTQCHGSETW